MRSPAVWLCGIVRRQPALPGNVIPGARKAGQAERQSRLYLPGWSVEVVQCQSHRGALSPSDRMINGVATAWHDSR